MKLKDYKNNSEQYEKIKNMCAHRGIVVNDETDMKDILEQNFATLDARVKHIGKKFDRANK